MGKAYPVATPRRALSAEQQRSYAQAAGRVPDPVLRTILLLLPLTGLRVGEVVILKPGDAVVHQGRPHLHVFGKGKKWRWVPLSTEAVHLLRGYHSSMRSGMTKWLFPTRNGRSSISGRVTTRTVEAAARRLAKDAPSLKGLTPHVLRHTFATNAVRACTDPKILQAVLGHTSIKTTLTYLHTLGFDLDGRRG
jgi:integrase